VSVNDWQSNDANSIHISHHQFSIKTDEKKFALIDKSTTRHDHDVMPSVYHMNRIAL